LKNRVRLGKTIFYVVTKPYSYGATRGTLAICFNERKKNDLKESRYDEIENAQNQLAQDKPIKEGLEILFSKNGHLVPARLAEEEELDGYSFIFTTASLSTAEMVKLLENTFRSVNIGLVNEVALMCDRLKLNAWEIIDAASTKPFGFMPFYPGPGLGGHCIPIDPHYLSWKLKSLNYYARFIELAGDINSHMPEYVIDRIRRILNDKERAIKNSAILVLGATYKRDIKDLRESPALDVLKLLEGEGAKVYYNDPHASRIIWNGGYLHSTKLTPALMKNIDLTVIVTDHTAYDYQWIVDHSKIIFDTRNATKKVRTGREKIHLL